MKNIRHNFNTGIKLQECTSASNSIHTCLSYIHFFNGHAYVCNTRIAIKADLTEISNFSEDEIQLLHDKYISAERLRAICKEQKIKVTNEGFVSAEGILYPFQTPEEKFPDIEKVFQNANQFANKTYCSVIEFQTNDLTKLSAALGINFIQCSLLKSNKALITFSDRYPNTKALMAVTEVEDYL